MPNASYEVRLCLSCGLRYPLMEGHPFGRRCPICLGETRLVLHRHLDLEPSPPSPAGTFPKSSTKSLADNENLGSRFREGITKNFAVLLDNIRSAWNVGSILRSADGFGFTHAYLCGITPTADNEAVTKTSLGAENSVPWSYHKDAVKLVKGLKAEGWKVYALEKDARALPIRPAASLTYGAGLQVLIVGNEVTGVDPELLDLCEAIYSIPMQGEKKSFNVAIAFSVAAFALQEQSKK